MLRQVIHNLLQNAQDASQAGQVKIKTMIDQSHAVLSVEDEGGGFPADILPHAFEPYMTTKAHGTGLGLAIVKKIVDEHKGFIKVENLVQTLGTDGASVASPLVAEQTRALRDVGTDSPAEVHIIGAMVTIQLPLIDQASVG